MRDNANLHSMTMHCLFLDVYPCWTPVPQPMDSLLYAKIIQIEKINKQKNTRGKYNDHGQHA